MPKLRQGGCLIVIFQTSAAKLELCPISPSSRSKRLMDIELGSNIQIRLDLPVDLILKWKLLLKDQRNKCTKWSWDLCKVRIVSYCSSLHCYNGFQWSITSIFSAEENAWMSKVSHVALLCRSYRSAIGEVLPWSWKVRTVYLLVYIIVYYQYKKLKEQ